MKKFAGIVVVIAVILAGVYTLNPDRIYELTGKTTEFIPQQQIPAGLVSLKAEHCGGCHTEIYREWKSSLHSKAFTDPFFTAYHKKDEGDPTCLICHVPLQNQSPVMLSSSQASGGLSITPNPEFDAELQQEGVTCAGCHVRDGVVYGPYHAKDLNAPHAVGYDEKFLQKSICNQCHEVPSKGFSLMRGGVCSTGMESTVGPWADKGYVCQDCHMPAVTRPLVAGFPPRKGRKHTWPGGYSSEQLKKVFSFKAQKKGSDLTITITNAGAGHKAPTGDPDRFIILEFYWIDENGHREILHTLKFKRQIIWQPIMFVLYDNRLAPGESLQLESTSPDVTEVFVDATYHVMTEWSVNRLVDNYGLDPEGLKDQWAVRRPFLSRYRIPFE
jgi:hypothetical protein